MTNQHDERGGLHQTRNKSIAAAGTSAAQAVHDIAIESGGRTATELRSRHLTGTDIDARAGYDSDPGSGA